MSKTTGLIFSVSGLRWDASMQPHPAQGKFKKEELLVNSSNGPDPYGLVEHEFYRVNLQLQSFYTTTLNLTTCLCGLTQCPCLWIHPNTGFKLIGWKLLPVLPCLSRKQHPPLLPLGFCVALSTNMNRVNVHLSQCPIEREQNTAERKG